MSDQALPGTSAATLREAFDRSFSAAPRPEAPPHEDLAAVTIGGEPYALRLADVAGLYPDRPVTWLPGSVPGLVGVVGLRGAVLPAYALAELLGCAGGAAPRWMAVVPDPRLGLLFDRLDGHLRVPGGDVTKAGGLGTAARALVRDVVRTHGLIRPIIHVPSVLDAIAALVGRHGQGGPHP